jgi:hypothetical protein
MELIENKCQTVTINFPGSDLTAQVFTDGVADPAAVLKQGHISARYVWSQEWSGYALDLALPPGVTLSERNMNTVLRTIPQTCLVWEKGEVTVRRYFQGPLVGTDYNRKP